MRFLIFPLLFLFTLSFAQEEVLTENFDNGIPQDWQVNSTNSKRKWYAKSYKDVHYALMSAYRGKGKPGYEVKTELHSPLLDLTDKSCKLRFSFADAYQNGQPLKVYLSNEKFDLIRGLNEANWENLVNNSERYDNDYEATDWIDLPKINQPFRICFVYDSNSAQRIITTVIQLSEVDVWCE